MEEFPKQESEDKYKAIADAQSFEELLAAMDQLGGIEGSKAAGGKFHSAEDLKERINLARGGSRLFLEGITRTGGLRDKVTELLSKESDKAKE